MKQLLTRVIENALDGVSEFGVLDEEWFKEYYGPEDAPQIIADTIETTKRTGYILGYAHAQAMYIKNSELRNELANFMRNAISEDINGHNIISTLDKAFKNSEAKKSIVVSKNLLKDAIRILNFLDGGEAIGIEIIENEKGYKLLRLKTKDIDFLVAPMKDDFVDKGVKE